MLDMEMELNENAKRLIEIHSEMYPFVHYGTTGDTWYIKSCDYDETFKTYRAFIRFIEDEVKEALLNYAINGELMMLAEALGEEK